jgi:hypothetical protein
VLIARGRFIETIETVAHGAEQRFYRIDSIAGKIDEVVQL